jgi:hypothetical protein
MNASFLPDLVRIFQTQLTQLEKEIGLYDEHLLWAVKDGIINSGGNLTLHLIGNLNHYIGASLGETGYIRNRENEFAAKDISSTELLDMIRRSSDMIAAVLNNFSETDVEQEYPLIVLDKPTSIQYFLLHLSAHLGYHLGQINYIRRILHA